MEATSGDRMNGPAITGLTSAQVQERVEKGLVNTAAARNTKTVGQIIASNIFTLFNLVNFIIFLLILATGKLANTLFMGVIITNTLIGIIQEIRAKRTIDKLAIISAVQACVIRDGAQRQIPVDQVVQDDVCVLAAGSQVSSDGEVLESHELEADESLLTGESEPQVKHPGDKLLSGSFIVAGKGTAKVLNVGQNNYAQQITAEAKRYKRAHSQILTTLNRVIKFISIIIAPVGLLLFASQYFRSGASWQEAIVGSSAGIIGMIPEGLVLLTSIAFAVGIVKLAMRKTVVQELAGIEVLARTNVLCLDKTGTLTKGTLEVSELVALDGFPAEDAALAVAAAVRASGDTNSTALALSSFFKNDPGWQCIKSVPFSSARKWSGAVFAAQGSWVIGAPEFILQDSGNSALKLAQGYAEQGCRVILLAHCAEEISTDGLPQRLTPKALVLLNDTIRPEAQAALEYFAANDVTIKIISGDNPATVAAVGRRLNLKNADRYIDASKLPDDPAELAKAADWYTVFGRVTPQQKKKLVAALKAAGNTVAMTGDGVNDVLALREADCGIAMASGSEAAKGTAHIVLLESDFTALPEVVAEGRQVINNIERVACLYLVKTTFSVLLSLFFIITGWTYPFFPIHQTLIGAVSIGIPSFFLALEKNTKRVGQGFLSKVILTALPGGITVAISIMALQLLQPVLGITAEQLRLAGVLTTGIIGLLVLLRVSSPFNWRRAALLASMAALFAGAIGLFSGILELPPIDMRTLLVTLVPAVLALPLMAGLAKVLSYVKKA